jgi:hypothetical protein
MYPEPPINFIEAASYTLGRNGNPVRHITFHHVVGSAASAISKFRNPASQVSSHFIVGANGITCMVDTDNTAWCNGNWQSNLESVTIEHEGIWLNGFRDENVINNSAQLVAWLRSLYPDATPTRHRDVSSSPTACPGELPVEEIWNKATALLNPAPVPPPVPPAFNLQITDIQNRFVITKKDADVWDLTFTKWSDAKSVKVLQAGTKLEVSATAIHPLGGTYYLTEYSYSKGIKNGINSKDVTDVTIPTPPPVEPPTPPTPPVEPPVPPVVPPVSPQSLFDWFASIVKKVIEFLKGWKK